MTATATKDSGVVRRAKGRILYESLNHDTNTRPWDNLPENRRERYMIAAEKFTEWLDAYMRSQTVDVPVIAPPTPLDDVAADDWRIRFRDRLKAS